MRYAPIKKYALNNDMRLLTRVYGICIQCQERIMGAPVSVCVCVRVCMRTCVYVCLSVEFSRGITKSMWQFYEIHFY